MNNMALELHNAINRLLREYKNVYEHVKSKNDWKNPFRELISKDIPDLLRKGANISSPYQVVGSYGKGRWTAVPWIAVFDSRITTSAQKGVYIVYLLNKDTKELFLTFEIAATEAMNIRQNADGSFAFTGVVGNNDPELTAKLQRKADEIRAAIPNDYFNKDGEYKNHRFYKSIETVNIGGLPFLPGTTELLENFLAELVADSSESAFERASLPRGIEERLAKVDWSVRDVLVGSLGSVAQFDDNIRRKYYYVPAKYVKDDKLPIRYIALYQSRNRFKEYAGIRYYGEVTYMQKVKRREIKFPMSRNNGDELYYAFRIKEWKTLPAPIAVKDEWVNEPKFTSLFLLEHSQQSFELFNIQSEEEYRLMVEINKAFDNLATSTADNNAAVYRINETRSVIVADGNFTITNDNGDILGTISVSNFARSPRSGFRKIKDMLGN